MVTDDGNFQFGKLIRLVAGVAAIVLLVQFAMDGGPAELARQLRGVAWQDWLILCTISVLVLTALSRIFQVSIRVVGVEMSFPAAFDYSAMNSFFNTILPMKGGILVRGLYLKNRYGITWGSYLFVLTTGQLMQLAMLAIIAAGFYITGHLPLHLPELPILTTLGFLIVVLIIGSTAVYLRRELVSNYAQKIVRGLGLWVEDLPRLLHFGLASLAFHGLCALRLWLAFSLVGHQLTLTEICVLYAALAAGLSWAMTPGNLGVKEAAIVLLAAILGMDTDAALAASIVDRITSLFITLAVGGFSAYRVSSATAAR